MGGSYVFKIYLIKRFLKSQYHLKKKRETIVKETRQPNPWKTSIGSWAEEEKKKLLKRHLGERREYFFNGL